MPQKVEKAHYSRPCLTTFGSIRNLTGGSALNGNDGGGGMTGVMSM